MTNDFMDFGNYKKELKLINNLNPYEEDMYSVLWHVIRECITEEKLTLRNVSADRVTKTIHTENLQAGKFPDFVILGEDYNPRELADKDSPAESKIYGSVEIKLIGTELDDCMADIEELLPYYKKVIFTDGLEWRFYGWDKDGKAAAVEYEENKGSGKREPKCSNCITLGNERKEITADGELEYIIDWKDVSEWKKLLKYLKSLEWK